MTSPTCSQRSPTCHHARRCVPPAAATDNLFLPRTAVTRRRRVLCRCAAYVESATDRIETHALVDDSIQASHKDILVHLSIHFPLTVECIIGLTVWLAPQMLLLPLLLLYYNIVFGGVNVAVWKCAIAKCSGHHQRARVQITEKSAKVTTRNRLRETPLVAIFVQYFLHK